MLNVGMQRCNWYFAYEGINYRICSIKGKWRLLRAAKKYGDWDFVHEKEYNNPWECIASNFNLEGMHEKTRSCIIPFDCEDGCAYINCPHNVGTMGA